MKSNILRFSFLLLAAVSLWSCKQYEETIPVKNEFSFSFERKGATTVGVSEFFNVIFTGTGEFVTLYDGSDSLKTWGNPGAIGKPFGLVDSLEVSYSKANTYDLTVVVTSAGKFGGEIETKVITKKVTVVDNQCKFISFKLGETQGGLVGDISINNDILFRVPDSWTDFNFAPEFSLPSANAKVFVMNGTDSIQQFTAVTKNDFNPALAPVEYIVRAGDGTIAKYKIKFTTYTASSEKTLTSFVLKKVIDGGNGEVGTINEADSSITVFANYGSPIKKLKLDLVSTGSKIYVVTGATSKLFDPNYKVQVVYDITASKIRVEAQNGTTRTYTINVTQDVPLESFELLGLIPSPKVTTTPSSFGVVDNVARTVTINVLQGTDVSKLIPKWTGSLGKVMIGIDNVSNGVSTVNFTNPVTFKFYGGLTYTAKNYVVTIVPK